MDLVFIELHTLFGLCNSYLPRALKEFIILVHGVHFLEIGLTNIYNRPVLTLQSTK